MRIDLHVTDDLCILRLRGRFNTGSDSDYLRTRDELQQTGCRNVIVDCREALYLDSSGISFIVELYKSLKNSAGYLALTGVKPHIREVLELMRLDEIIPVFEDEQAAAAVLKERAIWEGRAAVV